MLKVEVVPLSVGGDAAKVPCRYIPNMGLAESIPSK